MPSPLKVCGCGRTMMPRASRCRACYRRTLAVCPRAGLRTCRACGRRKPLSAFQWRPSVGKLRGVCKSCDARREHQRRKAKAAAELLAVLAPPAAPAPGGEGS